MSNPYTLEVKRPKFGSIQFDSQAEFDCFLIIKKYFPLHRIKVHQPVSLRPANEWFPEEKWKVDFTISNVDELGEMDLFIEYKGVVLDSFKEKMKSLAYFSPSTYQNLVIVSATQKVVTRGLISITPKQLEFALKNKDFVNLVNDCKKKRNV